MQHAAYVMAPPEAAYASMHPEMLQGMQGMPMPVMMGPMGPMMAAGPMGHGMMAPGGTMAPQLTQMLVEAARGGRSSNVFFKTRICNKWRAGSCPYGDKCTYAHGEHELRYVPPEIVAHLEAQQKLQEAAQQRGGGGPAGPGGEGGGGGGGREEGAGSHGGGGHSGSHHNGGGPSGGGHQSYYKTRLCIKYMQTGYCHKEASCTFAHGYEDLRQPGAPMSPTARMQQQDPMSPGRVPMMHGHSMQIMGGMVSHPMSPHMSPAAMSAAGLMPAGIPPGAGRGMPMPPGATGGMHMPMQMMQMGMPPPPPGPVRYSGGGMGGGPVGQQAVRSPRAGGHHSGREDPAAGARRRAQVMCQIAGVGDGSGGGGDESTPAAMQAAMVDVRSGAAYHESAYADSIADFMRQPAVGAGHANS